MPSLDQFLVFLGTLFVAACCISLGRLAGARRPGEALAAGWGVASLLLTVAGTFGGVPLTGILVMLAVISSAGWWRGKMDWTFAGRTLVLGLPFLLIAASTIPSGFDEYSVWLPNLSYLFVYDHFPSLSHPDLVSIRPGYPHGLAFVGLAVSRLTGRLAEGAGIIWDALLLLAVSSLAAELISRRFRQNAPWTVAAIGVLGCVLLSPVFVPKLYLSNYGDPLSGELAAILAAIVLADFLPVDRPRPSAMAGWVAGMCGAALVSVRQDSFSIFAILWGVAVLAGSLFRRRAQPIPWLALAAWLPLPAICWLSWVYWQSHQIPGGVAIILPWRDWYFSTLPDTLINMALIATRKVGYFSVVILLCIVAVWPKPISRETRAAAVVGAAIALARIVAVIGIYLAVDTGGMASRYAPQFWRLTVQAGPAVVLAGLAAIPWEAISWHQIRKAGEWRGWRDRAFRVLPIATMLAPIAFFPMLQVDARPRDQLGYVGLRGIAADLRHLVPQSSRLTLVDLSRGWGELDQLFAVRYRIVAGESVENARRIALIAGPEPTSVDIMGHMPVLSRDPRNIEAGLGAPYIWIANGGPVVSKLLGVPVEMGTSVLFRRDVGHLVPVAVWQIPKDRSRPQGH